LEAADSYKWIIDHYKYKNNYDYNQSIFMLNQIAYHDNGFLLLAENEAISSPISVCHYETYTDIHKLNIQLDLCSDEIQCIVGNGKNAIPFGMTQSPNIWDYADGIDTMQFLSSL